MAEAPAEVTWLRREQEHSDQRPGVGQQVNGLDELLDDQHRRNRRQNIARHGEATGHQGEHHQDHDPCATEGQASGRGEGQSDRVGRPVEDTGGGEVLLARADQRVPHDLLDGGEVDRRAARESRQIR